MIIARCENFMITLQNSCDGEIKATKFEYLDGSNWKTENMFNLDGHQKIEKDHAIPFNRALAGIGDESTKFRVTYKHHLGGTKWGPTLVETTDAFVAHDNGSHTVALTK